MMLALKNIFWSLYLTDDSRIGTIKIAQICFDKSNHPYSNNLRQAYSLFDKKNKGFINRHDFTDVSINLYYSSYIIIIQTHYYYY